jgi:hypothetical protein
MSEKVISGEMLVTGRDTMEVEMRFGKPDSVVVEFKNTPSPIPCSPHHNKLDWELVQRHHGFFLVIKYSVSVPTTIVWAVSFI